MTSQKAPCSSLAHPGARAAIDRCRSRPNCAPTMIENAIAETIIEHPCLNRAVKNELLRKPSQRKSFDANPKR